MILEKITYGATAVEDMVHGHIAGLKFVAPYQTLFEMCQKLRMASKIAARADRAGPTFWREFNLTDLADVPALYREGFRRSMQRPTLKAYHFDIKGSLVVVGLFNRGGTPYNVEIHYEDAIKWHHQLRLEARRAKAWAGDSSKQRRLTGHITDAEEDYRLGIA